MDIKQYIPLARGLDVFSLFTRNKTLLSIILRTFILSWSLFCNFFAIDGLT